MQGYVKGEYVDSDLIRVITIHYNFDIDKMTGGFIVDNVPTIEDKKFMVGERFYKPSTGEIMVKYKPRPLTTEEETELLKQKVILMQNALDEILLGGM